MNFRPCPPTEAAPIIACIQAIPDIQNRLRTTYEREEAAKFRALTLDELMAARDLSTRYGYSIIEAGEIVRRSRR